MRIQPGQVRAPWQMWTHNGRKNELWLFVGKINNKIIWLRKGTLSFEEDNSGHLNILKEFEFKCE